MTAAATITREEALAALASLVDHEHTHIDGDAIRVAPASTDEVAQVLGFANEQGLTVLATGSGTKLSWGNCVAPELVLSLERMNAVREHAWQDLTCTVQAGCTWNAMQSELARHGQFVALDPLWPARATVGGIIAANDSGCWRLRYGSLRDLVIGMTLVLADGTIAKTGGKVVKNVAGYDLHKLLIGSFGTLGVVTEVNFRLHPAEQDVRTWTVIAQDPEEFSSPLRALLHAQIPFSGVQLRASNGVALDISICTRPECFDDLENRVRAIFGSLTMTDANPDVWQAREQLFQDNALIVKASTLPAEICATAREIVKSAATASLDVSVVAQATGLMTIAFRGRDDAVLAQINQHRAQLKAKGGSVTVLQMPETLREKLDAWDCTSDALPMMREIKRRFDPKRILSPGRFVGGI
jgi:glycolate oxidase FAD binding subunit